ncbi:MAG: NAD(P)H-hydrate epimerase [Thermoanaerobaculia bacterium]
MTSEGALFPVVEAPTVTTEQMVEIDRLMVEELGIELIQMMENAGGHLAGLARARFLAGRPVGKRVVVLAGTGGNGGGALVAARRLHNWGTDARVFVTKQPPADSVTGRQLEILRRMDLPVGTTKDLAAMEPTDLVIDGIIGYSLGGPPTGEAAQLIEWANSQSAPVLALDVPSGLEATTGVALSPAIRATVTLTLALPKKGLRVPGVERHVGELYLADISVPPSLYKRVGIDQEVEPLFAGGEIVRLG